MTDPDLLQQAVRLLARRPHTEAEIRKALRSGGRSSAEIDDVCERMKRRGYLNDRELAADFIRLRSERLGHGPARLLRDLARRGVARGDAESALAAVLESGDFVPLDVLRGEIRRRTKGASALESRTFRRVYNAMLRAGFDEDMVRQELEPHLDHESDDDLR